MHQPLGFIDPHFPYHVYSLNKALYGLKYAPRAWYDKLKTSLLKWGFQSSRSDSSLFFQHTASHTLILLIHVDDIIVIGSSSSQVQGFIDRLHSVFALRDLGTLNFFLGIEVQHQAGALHLSQQKYISDLLTRTGMLDSKPATTPSSLGPHLSPTDGDPFQDVTMYRSTVGALQYATLTKPGITFSVNKACQFMSAPITSH